MGKWNSISILGLIRVGSMFKNACSRRKKRRADTEPMKSWTEIGDTANGRSTDWKWSLALATREKDKHILRPLKRLYPFTGKGFDAAAGILRSGQGDCECFALNRQHQRIFIKLCL